jgi:hypothetical protein
VKPLGLGADGGCVHEHMFASRADVALAATQPTLLP